MALATPSTVLMQLTGLKTGNKSAFNGCMLAVNEFTPPLILPFSFSPTEIKDDFHPQYEHLSAPGGAHQFPVFTGMSEHKVEFSLVFDARYPTVMAGDGSDMMDGGDETCADTSSNTSSKTGVTYSTVKGKSRDGVLPKGIKTFYVDSVIARLEKMKMPRNALTRMLMSGFPSMLFGPPDAAEPSPPLILLVTSPSKFYLGYLDNTIKQVQFNKYMMPTRIEVDCTFYTAPDMICTNLAELYRTLMATMGIAMAFSNTGTR